MASILDRERTVAGPDYSRWLVPPAALAVHLSIGQAYATSVYKTALVQHFDTSLTAIGVIFSIAIVMLGLSAAVGGVWVERNGPRKAMFVAACCWSSGFAIGALGVATTQLWLVYLGYGVIGGIGLGIGYIFSLAIVMLGLSAALFGTWVDRNGPRAAMFVSACFWSVGFLVGSLGIATDQLWLLYLGYGVIGGIGLGIGYISPVSTLIRRRR